MLNLTIAPGQSLDAIDRGEITTATNVVVPTMGGRLVIDTPRLRAGESLVIRRADGTYIRFDGPEHGAKSRGAHMPLGITAPISVTILRHDLKPPAEGFVK